MSFSHGKLRLWLPIMCYGFGKLMSRSPVSLWSPGYHYGSILLFQKMYKVFGSIQPQGRKNRRLKVMLSGGFERANGDWKWWRGWASNLEWVWEKGMDVLGKSGAWKLSFSPPILFATPPLFSKPMGFPLLLLSPPIAICLVTPTPCQNILFSTPPILLNNGVEQEVSSGITWQVTR